MYSLAQDFSKNRCTTVCCDAFCERDAPFLPCGHVFCDDCIRALYDVTEKTAKCPTCLSSMSVPSSSPLNLPGFFQDIHQEPEEPEVISLETGEKKNNSICSVCQNNVLQSYCFAGCGKMCCSCEIFHHQNFPRHVTSAVDLASLQYLVCDVHDGMFDRYCVDCSTPLCKACALAEHRHHKIEGFTANDTSKDNLDGEISNAENEVIRLKEHFEVYETLYDAHVYETLQEITAHKNELIRQLEAQEVSLRLELHEERTAVQQAIQRDKGSLRRAQKSLGLLRKTKHNLDQPFPQFKNISVKSAKSIVGSMKTAMLLADLQIRQLRLGRFVPQTHNLCCLGSICQEADGVHAGKELTGLRKAIASECLQLSKSSLFSATNSKEKTTESSGRLPAATDLRTNDSARSRAKFLAIHDNTELHSFSAKQQPTYELLWTVSRSAIIQSIDILPSGDVISVEGGLVTRQVTCYDHRNGKHKQNSHVLNINSPDAVAVDMTTGDIAASALLDDSVTVYANRGGHSSSSKHKVGGVCGIAYADDGHIIIGCSNWGSSTLLKIEARTADVLWEKRIEHSCHYIATDSRNRVILSERRFQQKICVYPESGEMFSFPKPKENGLLLDPRDICTDSNDNILVVDRRKEAVLMFNSKGRYIKEVVRVTGRPKYIALYRDELLCVATGSKEIHMYRVLL